LRLIAISYKFEEEIQCKKDRREARGEGREEERQRAEKRGETYG
jgi:hypothetical protein